MQEEISSTVRIYPRVHLLSLRGTDIRGSGGEIYGGWRFRSSLSQPFRSEHHCSDKGSKGENVKEQCWSRANYVSQTQRAGSPSIGTLLKLFFRKLGSYILSCPEGENQILPNSDKFVLKKPIWTRTR